MVHQRTLVRGKREPLGSTKHKEGAMSAVVGIDVGAYKHAAAVCRSGEREAERGVFRLSADRAGFDELERWLERQGPVDRVVLESSGHYYWPLASHLHRRGYQVAVVNPLRAKYFAKSRLQRSKSDPADARTLAALGMSEETRSPRPAAGSRGEGSGPFLGRPGQRAGTGPPEAIAAGGDWLPRIEGVLRRPPVRDRAGSPPRGADSASSCPKTSHHTGRHEEARRSASAWGEQGSPTP